MFWSQHFLSARIYDSLPEVQRRREEERRKAEYQSYRLNAQLYNKVRQEERVPLTQQSSDMKVL